MISDSHKLATGRRKTASVSVWLKDGTGSVTVNKRPFEEYFPTVAMQELALASLTSLDLQKKFDVVVRAKGGGLNGQAGAMRHAIARALSDLNREEYRGKLKTLGFLTRDPRSRERKKPGQPGARRRFQFSKR